MEQLSAKILDVFIFKFKRELDSGRYEDFTPKENFINQVNSSELKPDL